MELQNNRLWTRTFPEIGDQNRSAEGRRQTVSIEGIEDRQEMYALFILYGHLNYVVYRLSSIASISMGISIWCDCLMRLDPFWTAPELLRKPRRLRPLNGTKKGDVYSFAIIIQEVLINQIPFGIDLETLTPYGQHLTRLHFTVTTINSVNSTVTSAHNGHNYYNCMNMICGLLLRRSPGVVSASDFRTTPYFYQQQLIWAYVRSPSALFRV